MSIGSLYISSTLLYAVVFSFVIAYIFSMFGQGGGSIYSPLLLLLGFSVLLATSTSLVLNLITSLSAGYIFYRKKMIDYRTSLIFAPGISIGAFAGGALSKSIDTTILMWLFVAFLVAVGARMIYSYWEKEKGEQKWPVQFSTGAYALIAVVGLAVGFLAGLLGVGGGIFIVPFMVYGLKVPTKIAAGSSHLIISFSALAGILGHATSHHFDLPLIVVTGIAVLLGGNLGARFSMKIQTKMIKAGLGLIMGAFAVQLLVKLL
jgi:uncharacterized membrane protein YfcA